MRKTYIFVMTVAVALGLADWVIDAWFDYSTDYRDGSSFLDALMLQHAAH